MTFAEIVDAAHDHYLARLHAAVDDAHRAAPHARLVAEPAYRTGDGEIAHEGFFGAPLRQDLVVFAGDGVRSVEVPAGELASFAPAQFEWEGVQVTLGSFHWSDCRVSLAGVGQATAWRPLTAWYDAWFDAHDDHAPLKDGLRGAVHRLGDPRFSDGSCELHLDLGSAPAEAFEHLLDALARLSPTAITIGAT